MAPFHIMNDKDCKEVFLFQEGSVSLKAIVAIHNAILGPALCSCKIYDYENFEKAMDDAVSIARHNAYGAALNHKDMGGGAIVLVGDPKVVKSEMYFRTLGAFLNKLDTEIYLSSDVGIDDEDLVHISKETDIVLGLPEVEAGLGTASESAAKAVLHGIKAAVKHKIKQDDLKGVKVAVQGAGKVGQCLISQLIAENAEIIVTDIVYDKIKDIQDKESGIKSIKPSEMFSAECDVFCPCGPSGILGKDDVSKLKCKIIAGADGGFISEEIAKGLKEKDILYIPGYLINSGQIIHCANELTGFEEKTEEELKQLYFKTLDFLQKAEKEEKSLAKITENEAKDYIQKITSIRILL